MKTPIWKGSVKNGILTISNSKKFDEYLLSLNGEIELQIDRKRGKRTTNQNSFYWLYLGVIADETGEDIDDLHRFLKRKLLPPEFKEILGETIKLPATTTKLDKLEFGRYMEKICALTGVPIPELYQ